MERAVWGERREGWVRQMPYPTRETGTRAVGAKASAGVDAKSAKAAAPTTAFLIIFAGVPDEPVLISI